jgi:hypothetical protein
LLTHVHAGTIGWITLSTFAIGLWIFGEGMETQKQSGYVRTMAILAAVSFPIYVLAFLSGIAIARAVLGLPVLIAIVGIFGWIVVRSRSIRLGVTHLALLGAVFTLIVGSTFGVLLQIQFVTGELFRTAFLPEGAFGAHPAAQVGGYLILVGMALCEWRLIPRTDRLSIAGVIQITLLFISGFVLVVALLFNIPPLFGLNALLLVLGVGIFIARFLPRSLRVNWGAHSGERFFVFSALFLVVNIATLIYLTIALVTGAIKEVTEAPGVLLAGDHAIFIGVMTNAFFGLIQDATSRQRSLWSWADNLFFWGMNIGLTGFLVALILQQPLLERIFTPILGLSILLALLTYALRMRKNIIASAEDNVSMQKETGSSVPG